MVANREERDVKNCCDLDKIIVTVSDATGINPLEIKAKGSSEESFAKHLFYFLASNNTRHSLDFIGEYISGSCRWKRNSAHRMVVYAKQRIEQIIYKTERKRIMDDKKNYDIIQKCMNQLIFDGMPVRGNISPDTLAKYYEGVVQF
jgi:chromosomal replication initiation ATPase DnaA